MSPPWDVFIAGAAAGVPFGLFFGYQLRAANERYWASRKERKKRERNDYAEWEHDRQPDEQRVNRDPAFIPMARKRGIITPVDIIAPRKHEQPIPTVTGSWRDDVIAALVDAGYGKAETIKAVDACSLSERQLVETWVVAALRNAVGAK